MKKQTEHFKFLFPLTRIGPKASTHIAELEIHYTGHRWLEWRHTAVEYDVDIDCVNILNADGVTVLDIAPLIDAIELENLRARILDAAYNNVSYAFEQLDQDIRDYQGEIAMEEQRLNG